MAAWVRFEVLGPVQVRRGDLMVRVTGRRQRLVLVLLLSDPGRTVPMARLVDALWDDGEEPRDPVNTVQQYVAQLRRILDPERTGKPMVVTSPPGYRLDLDAGQLDAGDAAVLAGRARHALADRRDEECVALATAALGLWRGRPFDEFADHPVLLGAVARAEELRLALVADLVDALRVLGRPARIVELLTGSDAWAEHPRLAEAHVDALAALGRQGDALAAADRHRLALAERGLEPDAAMRRLTADVATLGRARADPGRPASRTALVDALRDLLLAAPAPVGTSADPAAGRDYQLAVTQALAEPAILADAPSWLAQCRRHEPAVLDALDRAVVDEPAVGLVLALRYARYWDWTGQHDRLRAELGRLVDAVGGDVADANVAEAAGWLAFAHQGSPAVRERYLAIAVAAAAADPLAVGRVRAVEAVVRRDSAPDAALAAAEAAVALLGTHGQVHEAAYAHVVAAFAALAGGQRVAAEHHATRAEARYLELGDQRGLAWVDVIVAELAGTDARQARRFVADHDEHSTRTLLAP